MFPMISWGECWSAESIRWLTKQLTCWAQASRTTDGIMLLPPTTEDKAVCRLLLHLLISHPDDLIRVLTLDFRLARRTRLTC